VHLLLTDHLCCPRCGPDFGLILRADRIESRVVLDGVLGCPNCRDSFSIAHGFADLRAPPRGELDAGLVGGPAEPRREEVERLVALLGVVGGPGAVVLVGHPARLSSGVAGALPESQVVGVDPDLRLWAEAVGVSRLAAAPGLPLRTASARAIAIDGRLDVSWLTEAFRVALPRSRLVVTHAGDETASRLRDAGLVVLAEERETVVAATK